MKTCYHFYLCDDVAGELEGFFEHENRQLRLVHWWSCNDAHFQHEYMGGLFRHFGVKMLPLPKALVSKATALFLKEIS